MDEQKKQIQKIIEDSFIKEFLTIDTITDISYNGTHMFVKDNKKGSYQPENQPKEEEVFTLARKIADVMGKEFNNHHPRLNTELDYLRVNFIHRAISPSGCTFSIRISKPILRIKDIAEISNRKVATLLDILVKAKTNMIISGQTGSGKTELQKTLVGSIPDNQYITLIEDTMDSHIKAIYPDKNINSWRILTDDTRDNKIYFDDLTREGLRNNPDWLIIAETRGNEVKEMIEGALTDHAVITTIHAKKANKIISRIMAMTNRNDVLFGQDISSVLNIGIYMNMEETEAGVVRYIREIVEFTGFDETGVHYRPLYEVKKDWDIEREEYIERQEMNPISTNLKEELIYKNLYHLLPDEFKASEDNSENRTGELEIVSQ